jgi:hypothetical protein
MNGTVRAKNLYVPKLVSAALFFREYLVKQQEAQSQTCTVRIFAVNKEEKVH